VPTTGAVLAPSWSQVPPGVHAGALYMLNELSCQFWPWEDRVVQVASPSGVPSFLWGEGFTRLGGQGRGYAAPPLAPCWRQIPAPGRGVRGCREMGAFVSDLNLDAAQALPAVSTVSASEAWRSPSHPSTENTLPQRTFCCMPPSVAGTLPKPWPSPWPLGLVQGIG
jgi:hypothetical protein